MSQPLAGHHRGNAKAASRTFAGRFKIGTRLVHGGDVEQSWTWKIRAGEMNLECP